MALQAPSERHAHFAAALAHQGFGVCHGPFSSLWYNQELEREQPQQECHIGSSLPHLPRGQAWLIGNTRHLWPVFLAWLQTKQPRIPANPIDTYTTIIIQRLVQQHFEDYDDVRIFWDYNRDPDQLISMSRVATVSGFCFTHPSAFLSIHPTFGPWISLRAVVVVVDNDGDTMKHSAPAPAPPRLENPLSEGEDASVQAAARSAFASTQHSKSFDTNDNNDSSDPRANKASMRPWVNLRDSVPIGRDYRFSEHQLWYHYLKDRKILEIALSAMKKIESS